MDHFSSTQQTKIVPAQLSFLAIYNPSLGVTEETFQDQIVFYFSQEVHARKRQDNQDVETDQKLQEEENEKQRQIGLAQGMANFARSFAAGQQVDHIDTERSRIVIHELEPDWWILASINLTKIQHAQQKSDSNQPPSYDYSSRDLSPPALLTSQLITAYRIFLLHNGSSLSQLFNKSPRSKFCAQLDRFWTRFAAVWDPMLHGTPATDLLGGMKLAAGGELGVGVGEEEWGSGEREVLEDFTRRTDGLTDLLVLRYGDVDNNTEASGKTIKTQSHKSDSPLEPWLGIGRDQQAADGVVYSGTGAISRLSLQEMSQWMRWIYSYGEHAYGVRESPSSDRSKRKKRVPATKQRRASTKQKTPADGKSSSSDPPPSIPRPILAAAEKSYNQAVTDVEARDQAALPSSSKDKRTKAKSPTREPDSWTKYLTFGYGTAWGVTDTETETPQAEDVIKTRLQKLVAQENNGYFLIGMRGDPEDESDELEDNNEDGEGWNKRLMIRTIHVEMTNPVTTTSGLLQPDDRSQTIRPPGIAADSQSTIRPTKRQRVRVVVYVHRPFIYALLFDPATAALSIPPFYRHIHTFLSPLRSLLLRSTGPQIARQRMASDPGLFPAQIAKQDGVWAAVHDFDSRYTWSWLPAIPQPHHQQTDISTEWSRQDAIGAHLAAVEILSSVNADERERSVKTSRGWWVVWAKQQKDTHDADRTEQAGPSEGEASNQKAIHTGGDRVILIVRRPKEAASGKSRVVSGWGFGEPSDSSKLESSRMGIGFDPRRYMEGIVRLGR